MSTPTTQTEIRRRLAQARQLITEKRYDDARQLLATIDHPVAKEWLSKLGDKRPARYTTRRTLLVIAFIAVIAMLIVVFALQQIADYQRGMQNTRDMWEAHCTDLYKRYSEQWQNCVDDY